MQKKRRTRQLFKDIPQYIQIDGAFMIGIPSTGALTRAAISAVCFEGLSAETCEGRKAMLAIIDESGKVIEAGPAVAREAWNVTLACYKQFLAGQGHLRVFSAPPKAIN